MDRRRWLTAIMVLLSPLLLFTVWAALLAFHAINVWQSFERYVANRSVEPIWVEPIAFSDRGPVRLPHYDRRWPTYSPSPYGEKHIPPGEDRLLVVDHYFEMEHDNSSLLVRTQNGNHYLFEWSYQDHYVIEDPHSLPRASDEVVAALSEPVGVVNFGVPVWVIALIGTAAPIMLCFLHSVRAKLKR